jgi:NAD(P)H dehydrogenase (quinone)
MVPLLHLGMILIGVVGDDNKRQIDEQEAAICRALGRRLAIIGLKQQRT